MLYRILTEDKNRPNVIGLVTKRFPGFTLLSAQGYWQGTAENSLALEIDTDKTEDVFNLAREIKAANGQQAVLVQELSSKATLV